MNSTRAIEGARALRVDSDVARSDNASANTGSPRQIGSSGVLYANALAIEREAEARYRELAAHMVDCGNEEVADLFVRLAEFEGQHAHHLAMKCIGINIPAVEPGEYAWLDSGPPVPEARAFVFRMMTPYMALEIALDAEVRAKAFFEQIAAGSSDQDVQELAREFAQDELAHVAWVKDAMARMGKPYQPSDEHPGDPTIEQLR